MIQKKKKRALGRGIAALIPDMGSSDNKMSDYFPCDINSITPNKYQPRQNFSRDELKELSESIKEQGIIQPLLVRKSDSGYELIAGERRLRASKMANLTEVPVIVKDISDKEMLELSIIENIQRQDLNPMEEAEAYQKLADKFHLTQDEVAIKVGKSRSAVTNFIRLLKLPGQIKESISKNSITMGHARALLGIDDSDKQIKAWQLVITNGLSVRQTEALIKQLKTLKPEQPKVLPNPDKQYFANIANNITTFLNTDVHISRKGNKGKIQILFKDNKELERLSNLLQNK